MVQNKNTERLRAVSPKPGLFSPTTIKNLRDGSDSNSNFLNTGASSVEEKTALGSTASFKYDVPGSGLKSTQQLNVDWSAFENHTFFNSAQVKTNIAFDKIVNEFPFDGTKKEQELFFDKLTGFEKWVYDEFPKNKGYLFFSGSSEQAVGVTFDAGTVVTVKDLAGAQFPTLSRLRTGETVLDPGLKSMTLEFWVNPSNVQTEKAGVITMLSGTTGFSVQTGEDGGSRLIQLSIASGSVEDQCYVAVPDDQWTHVSFVWDRTPGIHSIYGYRNNVLIASSSMPVEMKAMNIGGSDLFIGSGSTVGSGQRLVAGNLPPEPDVTFSGSIDELRIWHRIRTNAERTESFRKPVQADDDLKLYFKFNEPSGSNSNLVLDHSNNSIHGRLNTNAITLGVREIATGSLAGASPMTNEKLFESPVLFPEHPDSLDLRDELLLSASKFDEENPNMISRLIPRHYFLEGMAKDSLETEEGNILTDLSGAAPREATLGSTQVLLSLLYTWAKFFDEMKLYIQAFSSLKTLDYDEMNTIPSDFLSVFARNEGIDLPPLFTGTSLAQYVEGDNLQGNVSRDVLSLQNIQNQIWRRILINLQDVLKSKGTVHSIKSFIRSVGINPDNNFRIREYGGPTNKPLSFNREKRFEVSTMLNFTSGGLLTSPTLFRTKTEPGWPVSSSALVAGNDNTKLTSGSFTYEATYKFQQADSRLFASSQSLVRFYSPDTGVPQRELLMNVVATSASVASGQAVKLYVSSDTHGTGSVPILELEVTGVNVFDGAKWYMSVGRRRGDDPLEPMDALAQLSSSYFIRLSKQNHGKVLETHVTSAYYFDGTKPGWERTTGLSTHFQIGSASIPDSGTGQHLNAIGTVSDYRATTFEGKVTQIRFWSKYLTGQEWPEHVLNYRSVGVRDPKKNFNFLGSSEANSRFSEVSGSWNRLRIDASTDQIVTSSDSSGDILLTDFTQNSLIMTGAGFIASTAVIEPEPFWFSFISPKIDEGVTDNKVRVRGYQNSDKAFASPWSDLAPAYEVNPREKPTDSAKLSIDFSIVDTLDQDIMTIFGSLDELNNVLGDPELQFASGYKELEVIRELYFEKLESKINLKGFFEFYKWFDTNIGSFVEQLVPRKTRFLGTNFVIESHFLERNKIQYQFEDIYLGEDIRSGLKDTILLQLITGKISRF